MLLFAGHDPGSINHVRPLMLAAREGGHLCRLLELRPSADSDGLVWPLPGSKEAVSHCRALLLSVKAEVVDPVEAVVMGISTNKAELDMVAACKAMGIHTTVLVDFFAGHRLEGRDPNVAFPDVLMVTNEAAAAELRERYQLVPKRLCFVGSTYIESLVMDVRPPRWSRSEVYRKLSLDESSTQLLPFFVSPDDMVPEPVAAIAATLSCLHADLVQVWGDIQACTPCQGVKCLAIVVRLHPRNSKDCTTAVETLCKASASGCEPQHVSMILDVGSGIDNKSLCRAAACTLSMGSTVSVESAAWGSPSAFYQRGWDPHRIEKIMGGLPVKRITVREHLTSFMQSSTDSDDGEAFNVENCAGAIQRGLACIHALCDDQ